MIKPWLFSPQNTADKTMVISPQNTADKTMVIFSPRIQQIKPWLYSHQSANMTEQWIKP